MELLCFMNLHAAILALTFLIAIVGTCLTTEAAPPVPAGPAWAWNLPVYETSIDFATPNTKFREFEQRLDMFEDLGVGIIWFIPIFPVSGNPPGKPRSESPYCVRDYYEVNPRYGTKDDFKHLVGAIHGRGMRIIMDWVPNHTAWGNELIKTHTQFYKKDKDGQIIEASSAWKDVAKLDYSNRDVWEYMYEARKYWITQFDIDGFREDVAGAIPLAHWQWLRPRLDALKPLFMLAEAEEPRLHPVFDMTYDWTSQAYFYMIARGTWPASSLNALLDTEQQQYPAGAFRMRHLTNHDMEHDQYAWDNRGHLDPSENDFLLKTPLPAKYAGGDRAFAVLCATLPNSKPMIWNGQELGILARTPKLQWTDSPYMAFYRKLFHAYRQNPALYQGEFQKIGTSKPEAVYAFCRRSGENQAIVVVNLTKQPCQITMELGESAGRYTEVFTGEERTFAAHERLDLEPWAYRVYLRRK
jgi:cyclomaltodextrinase / maltogenic alpha-amylase / neopullulanase